MCDVLTWFFNTIIRINWLEVFQALGPVATAVIAFLALKNWKRQDKAKREVEFLDALIEATHAYVEKMPEPLTLIEIAKIGMASHGEPGKANEDSGPREIFGAIAYIEKEGERESNRLRLALDSIQPTVIRLRSLAGKGQVFKFSGYEKCYKAVTELTWHFGRMEAISAVIGSRAWNWENPDVLAHLQNVMAINLDDIRKSLEANNVVVLQFATDAYEHLYG